MNMREKKFELKSEFHIRRSIQISINLDQINRIYYYYNIDDLYTYNNYKILINITDFLRDLDDIFYYFKKEINKII